MANLDDSSIVLFILVIVVLLVATGAGWVGYQLGRLDAENERRQ